MGTILATNTNCTMEWNGNMRYGNHPSYKHLNYMNIMEWKHEVWEPSRLKHLNLYMHCLFSNNYTLPGSGMELETDLTSLHIVPSVS